MIFKVIAIHKSEYPNPIHFKKGDQLFVGKNILVLRRGITGTFVRS